MINLTISPKRPKKAGITWTYNFTKEEKDEVIKCSKDPIYFIKNYVKILTNKGMKNFELFEYQEKMIHAFQDKSNVICKIGRQQGKTTTCAAFYLWYALFHRPHNIRSTEENKLTIALLANKQLIAREILDRIKSSIELLPDFLYPQIDEWNKYSVTFGNGSKFVAAATSSSGIRGMTINCVTGDSIIKIKNKYTQIEETVTMFELYKKLNNFNEMVVVE